MISEQHANDVADVMDEVGGIITVSTITNIGGRCRGIGIVPPLTYSTPAKC